MVKAKFKVLDSTKTNTRTSDSGAKILPVIGGSFLDFETNSSNRGNGVFASFERTDTF